MSGFTFQNFQDPYGFNNGEDPPRSRPKPPPAPFRVSSGMKPGDLAPPVVLPRPAAPARENFAPQMAAYRQRLGQALQQPNQPPAAAPTQAAMPPSLPSRGSSEPDDAPRRPQSQPQLALPQSQGPSMFAQQHAQHFGQLKDAVSGVNQAMSGAAKQWSDAAARNQAAQSQQSMVNQAAQLERERTASSERMSMAELQHKKQKTDAILGAMGGYSTIRLGGNGQSPLATSLLG